MTQFAAVHTSEKDASAAGRDLALVESGQRVTLEAWVVGKDRLVATSDESDLRAWEWHYQWRLGHSAVRTFDGHRVPRPGVDAALTPS